MFERFTERSRPGVALARDEAHELRHNETMKVLSGPGRRIRAPIRQVVIACPACGHQLDRVVAHRPSTTLQVSAEGERTCAGCGKRWTISYDVTWREPSG